ncbi:MAG: hypothetical protein WC992_01180 [Acholeplasmataceae bacterium]|jgi:hypothetical protein|nr:hypothetical protein [Acholeplasmataceae bacterium]
MNTYTIPWAFILKYNYPKQQLKLHSSTLNQASSSVFSQEMIWKDDKIRHQVHKYDYRKLIYFSQNPLIQPFDTMLRLKDDNQKSYVRTQAICKSHPQGFHCILVDDYEIHQLKPKWKIQDHVTFQDQAIFELMDEEEVHGLKDHLAHMMDKLSI